MGSKYKNAYLQYSRHKTCPGIPSVSEQVNIIIIIALCARPELSAVLDVATAESWGMQGFMRLIIIMIILIVASL